MRTPREAEGATCTVVLGPEVVVCARLHRGAAGEAPAEAGILDGEVTAPVATMAVKGPAEAHLAEVKGRNSLNQLPCRCFY